MRRFWIVPVVSLALGHARAASADPPVDSSAVLERVVAVVGHEAIFLSELRARAAPLLKKVDAEIPDGARRVAAREQATRDVLDRMIEERLIAVAADKARITVLTEEVDRALESVASSQKLTVPQLLRAASDQGLDERAYRAELRRQLLEGKLLLRLATQRQKGSARLTGNALTEAMTKERERMLAKLRQRTFIEKR